METKKQNASKPEADRLTKTISQFRVSLATYRDAVQCTEEQGVTLTTLIRTALEEYLNRYFFMKKWKQGIKKS